MIGGFQASVMIAGNKSDRVSEREVSSQEGSALAKDMGCDFVEASAKQCIDCGIDTSEHITIWGK